MNRLKWTAWLNLGALLVAPRLVCADTGLTIYNQNFAVVRDTIKLDLKEGVNQLAFTDTSAHLEPDSIILRDPTGQRVLRVLEQNYRADPISQELLLSLFEGKTIDFLVQQGDKTVSVKGKIIRSGYVPHNVFAMQRYGSQYAAGQYAYSGGFGGYGGNAAQPLVEVDGKIRFGLPGTPLFPALPDDTILKPTLNWKLATDKPGPLTAELSYVTGGMSWEADYNFVTPQNSDTVEMVGWVTMDNQSGKDFENATIKLMAGDVSKIQNGQSDYSGSFATGRALRSATEDPNVTEKAFDEYHLYTLTRPTTLHDRETKQVEFVRASGIKTQRVYVYNGAYFGSRYQGYSAESLRQQSDYGTQSNPKVWVMREFRNTKENGLGIPLPKGRVRFYQQDAAGANGTPLEFTGENVIDHTPKDELLRVYTGDAFDIVGERKQTNFQYNGEKHTVDETFSITLRNHKAEPVNIRVTERLYRWTNWTLTAKTDPYTKTDSQKIEFRVTVPANGERVVSYTVHYSW